MQIGKQHLAGSQLGAFGELGLFDFNDEVGGGKDFGGVRRDARSGALIVPVGEADARAGAGFHQHLMTPLGQIPNARGRQTHPILVDLDFLGYADSHC